jgi:hypothetical protein
MKDFAARRQGPYQLDQYTSQVKDKVWVIRCPKCSHKVTYIEPAANPRPYFAESDKWLG